MAFSKWAGRQRWRRLATPSLFFAAVIYYEELFLKLYCFHALTVEGVIFTLLFTLPIAALLGLLCGGVTVRRGRVLLPVCTFLVSLWFGSQIVYYHLFQTFMTIFSLTKMTMVADSFGTMVTSEILLNWFPVIMMLLPVLLSIRLRARLIVDQPQERGLRLQWAAMAAAVQLVAMGIVMLCGGGVLSLRYIYIQAAAPELEAQYFGLLTQTQMDVRRMLFGIEPDPRAKGRIVLFRSFRYRNDRLSWLSLRSLRDRLLFLGSPEEYGEFAGRVCRCDYLPTRDFLEAARLIRGAALTIGNQTGLFAVAEALKVPRLLEISPGCPNVIMQGGWNRDLLSEEELEAALRLLA